MNDFVNTLLALLIVLLSVFLVFRLINALAVFLRARKIKNKKVNLPPKLSKILIDRGCLVVYFSSPLAEKGSKKMSNVMKLINEEYKNVVKLDITKDKKEAELLNAISAPTTIIIDRSSIVRYYFTGFKPYPSVKSMIEKIIKSNPQ